MAQYDLDEDYVSPEERAEILRLFKPASRQNFASEAEQREYLRLVRAFERPRSEPFFTGPVLVGMLLSAAVGLVVGLLWKRHKEKAHPTAVGEEGGLDSLGADVL